MKLMHYASAPVEFDRDKTYEQDRPCSFGKPVGFWVSVLGQDDLSAIASVQLVTSEVTA